MPQPKPGCHTAEDYWSLPDGVRAELIDGELWDLASPSRIHQKIVISLAVALTNFIAERGGPCQVYPAPFAVNLFGDDSTFVEPDVSVVCDRSKLSDRGCEGAPDLVVEVVSPSNPRRDYVIKASLYLEAGVREYWVCDPRRGLIFAYDFDSEAEDVIMAYAFDDPVPSVALPGFVADFAGMVADM